MLDIVIGICVSVFTIAVVVLVVVVFRFLKTAGSTLDEARVTITDLRTEVMQMTAESRQVLHNTNAVTADVQKKMQELDGLFSTVGQIGQATNVMTAAISQTAAGIASRWSRSSESVGSSADKVSAEAKQQAEQASSNQTVEAVVDGVVSAVRIWNKLKKNETGCSR